MSARKGPRPYRMNVSCAIMKLTRVRMCVTVCMGLIPVCACVQSAVEITGESFSKYKKYKEIAGHIKKEMDTKHSDNTNNAMEGVFHCIVGKSFAASVSHDCRDFIHMKVGLVHVILFKSRDSPFDSSMA